MSEAPPNRRSPAPGWQDVLDAPVFVGSSPADVRDELRLNTWTLAASRRQRAGTTPDELSRWIERLVADRKAKLREHAGRRATFYLWLDEVSGTLSTGLVSDIVDELPFAGRVNVLASAEPILRAFLRAAPPAGAVPAGSLPEVDVESPLPGDADIAQQDVYAVAL